MGRPAKRIKYISSSKGRTTGIVFGTYKENGKTRRKSFSWHYSNGRTEQEATSLLEAFLDEKAIGNRASGSCGALP